MKKLFTLMFVLLLAGSFSAQQAIINDFDAPLDTASWGVQINDSADSTIAGVDYSIVEDPVHNGSGALLLEYTTTNDESWGGFSKIEHYHPDSNGVYDLSSFDTLGIWYYNMTPCDKPGRVHLRINLYEVSDAATGANTYDATQTEFYYSFLYILDSEPGWNYFGIPLKADGNFWDGEGFNRTGWSGIVGNDTFDPDQIKGFCFEFSMSGAGEGDTATGKIVLDHFAAHGLSQKSLVFFNGAAVPGTVDMYPDGWAGHQVSITDEDAYEPGSNSIKWLAEWGDWSGLNFEYSKPVVYNYHWEVDTLKFKIKAPADYGDLLLVFTDSDTDGDVKEDYGFEATYNLLAADVGYDGNWKQIAIPLTAFDLEAGVWDNDLGQSVAGVFDPAAVKKFSIRLPGGSAAFGKQVYLDQMWTGNPEFDVIAPEAPGMVAAAPGQYINLVTWTDVPGEESESYTIYGATSVITDVEAPYVQLLATGIDENVQTYEHRLRSPLNDQEMLWYYAVVCNDAAGNAGDFTASDGVTNNAKGIPVVHFGTPAGFAADGDLGEWSSIAPFRMFPDDGSGSVVTNTDIDNNDDLSSNAYVAVDDEYLYVAFEVFDDIVAPDTTLASYLTDAPDLYIGLYDIGREMHTNYQRGAEPDYHFRFNSNQVIIDNLSAGVILRIESDDYSWVEQFPSGYNVEAKISLAELAEMGDDEVFVPTAQTRVPIDFSINDADDTGEREGILTYSPFNEDLSYQSVSRWLYTWIGDEPLDASDESTLPVEYTLNQNFPNPFNPATIISYSLVEAGNVSLKVYNMLGEEVAQLVNTFQQPGQYQITFDAQNLAGGVYFYRIQSGNFTATKKMILMK